MRRGACGPVSGPALAPRACSREERKAHMASSVIAALWPTQQTRGRRSSGSLAWLGLG